MEAVIANSCIIASASSQMVSVIAFAIAAVALVATFGPWDAPFELRTIRAFEQRFGRTAARVVLLLFAIAMAALGTVILLEIRPTYARSVSFKTRIFGECNLPPRSTRFRHEIGKRIR